MIADIPGAFHRGGQMADEMRGIRQRNALADLYRAQGPGIAAGDPGALNALAGLDPMAARGIRREGVADVQAAQRHGMAMQQGQMGLQIDRARLNQIHQQSKIAMEQHAAKMSAAEAAAEAQKIDAFMSGAAAAWKQGPEQFQGFVQSQSQGIAASGFDPASITYESFPQVAAGLIGMREGLQSGVRAAGDLTAGPEFRQITGDEAQAMGLDPSKAYNMGADGKVTAIGSGGVTFNQAPQVGSIPQGYQLVQVPGPDGAMTYQMAPISGGPADTSVKDAKAQEIKETQANIVIDEIGLARDLIQGQSGTSPATGIAGSLMSRIDSTRAGALKNRLTTIKSNLGLDKLQSMRDASPTGGALGQVSDFENRVLQAVFGSLEQAQRAEDVLYNLNRIEALYKRVIHEGIPEQEARALYMQEVRGDFNEGAKAIQDDIQNMPDFRSMTDEELDKWIAENGG